MSQDTSQVDALYCILGELYFQHVIAGRRSQQQAEDMAASFQKQLDAKNIIIADLQKKSVS